MNKKFAVQSIIALLLLVVIIGFSLGKSVIQINRQGDSAIFEQLLENIHAGKGAVSNVFAATQNFIDRQYTRYTDEQLLKSDLIAAKENPRGMMRFHAYWVLFLLSPLLYVFNSTFALDFIQTLAYLGLVFSAGLLVFNQTKKVIPALLFGGVVAIYPVVLGGATGQFYPDRLFVALGFVLCATVYFKRPLWQVVFVAFCACLLNERAALIGGMVLIMLPLCSGELKNLGRQHYLFFGIGLAMICYAGLINKLWIINPYYSSFMPGSYEEWHTRLGFPGYINNTVQFCVVNTLLLGLSLYAGRLIFVPLAVMLPNLIGTVGGAEKTGWLMHYHSYYFPVLVFTAAIGFSRAIKSLRNEWLALAFSVLVMGVAALVTHREIDAARLPSLAELSFPFKALQSDLKGEPTGYSIRDEAIALVPSGSLVVTDETGMALLKGHVRVDRFPVSLDAADYIFMPCATLTPSTTNQAVPQAVAKKGFALTPVKQLPAVGQCLYAKES